jgi:hypothetical protein
MNPETARSPRANRAEVRTVGRAPTRREKLGESWPLLTVGAGCVAFGVVLIIEHTARLVDHISPTFLFFAVGLTGIAGGVASYIVGPQANGNGRVAPTEGRPRTPALPPRSRSVPTPAAQAGGRPTVAVGSAGGRPLTAPARPSRMGWGAPAESGEVPPSLILDPELIRPPAWSKGRLLRLSEEGALTVYSVDDALRELDLVSKEVHQRPVKGAEPSGGGQESSGKSP